MTSAQARSAYRQSEQLASIHPVKLIYLMYERVLAHLDLVSEGIDQDDPGKRGENLGKAIAIITELNASIKKEDDSEAAAFLRGLYTAILVELPKVTLNNDKTIVRQSRTYIARLMELWAKTAMREHGLVPAGEEPAGAAAEEPAAMPSPKMKLMKKPAAVGGLSISI